MRGGEKREREGEKREREGEDRGRQERAQLTSGTSSSYAYSGGMNNELSIAFLNSGGSVCPPFAMTWCRTEPAPADWPQMVTAEGSPVNLEIWG